MKSALNLAEFSEIMSIGRSISNPKTDLQLAILLDKAGDKFKAEGKLESAKVCYARALSRAIKAGI